MKNTRLIKTIACAGMILMLAGCTNKDGEKKDLSAIPEAIVSFFKKDGKAKNKDDGKPAKDDKAVKDKENTEKKADESSDTKKKTETKTSTDTKQKVEDTHTGPSIAVFVPGIMADSPIYAMLADGVKNAVTQYNYDKKASDKAELYILEAGTNQAQWPAKITSLAATKKYDVIISSNPSLPELVKPIIKQYPKQKFILMDAELEGNPNVYTMRYNQYEQAYLTGYIAGLMSKNHKAALIAAQEYPVMNEIIYPYFEKGCKAAYAKTEVAIRIVGNWYDANKGAVIADSLINNGFDVLLPICGGASQGVINSAKNKGIYVTWFDNNGFEKAPGTIISSTTLKQKEMADIVTANYLAGILEWGKADMVGVADKYVAFVQDDPNYISTVPEKIRKKMSKVVHSIETGKLDVTK